MQLAFIGTVRELLYDWAAFCYYFVGHLLIDERRWNGQPPSDEQVCTILALQAGALMVAWCVGFALFSDGIGAFITELRAEVSYRRRYDPRWRLAHWLYYLNIFGYAYGLRRKLTRVCVRRGDCNRKFAVLRRLRQVQVEGLRCTPTIIFCGFKLPIWMAFAQAYVKCKKAEVYCLECARHGREPWSQIERWQYADNRHCDKCREVSSQLFVDTTYRVYPRLWAMTDRKGQA